MSAPDPKTPSRYQAVLAITVVAARLWWSLVVKVWKDPAIR